MEVSNVYQPRMARNLGWKGGDIGPCLPQNASLVPVQIWRGGLIVMDTKYALKSLEPNPGQDNTGAAEHFHAHKEEALRKVVALEGPCRSCEANHGKKQLKLLVVLFVLFWLLQTFGLWTCVMGITLTFGYFFFLLCVLPRLCFWEVDLSMVFLFYCF